MIFITGNQAKVKEFEEILGIKLDSKNIDLPEIQAVDVEKVVEQKAKTAYAIVNIPVIVEDTGLYFNELNGLPGALIKWFQLRLSNQAICGILKKDRSAIAKTCICYYDGKEARTFVGEIRGEIALIPKGENGFGWDDIFIPEGENRTFAEIENKNEVSMRKIALDKFKEYLCQKTL